MIVKTILIAMCIVGNTFGEIVAAPNDQSILLHSSGPNELIINRDNVNPGDRHNADENTESSATISDPFNIPFDVLSQANDLKVANRNKRQFFDGGFGGIVNVLNSSPHLAPVGTAMSVIHNDNENRRLVEEQEAQRQANEDMAEANRKAASDKRARMYARIDELNRHIETLRRKIAELNESNRTAWSTQRLFNYETIRIINEEIELANAEIDVYRKVI